MSDARTHAADTPGDCAGRRPLATAVDQLAGEAFAALRASARTAAALDAWESGHLGRSSALAGCTSRIGRLAPAERAAAGRHLSAAMRRLGQALAEARQAVPETEPVRARRAAPFDPACPPPVAPSYGPHPITRLSAEVVQHFVRLGFSYRESRQLEDAEHSFDLLGVPEDSALRGPRHSFRTDDGSVLRGHTTASLLRALREQADTRGGRFVVEGACHRNTVPNRRHLTQFHVVEAIAAGSGVRLGDLKDMALSLVEEVLGERTDARLRFHRAVPYVSAGLGIDVDCGACGAGGCEFCFGTGRVEIASGGLLARDVLSAIGMEADAQAIALSVSVERVLAVRHGLGDVRLFMGGDLGFLAGFG